MPNPTFYIEDATVTIRSAEVPAADFDNGMNLAGSCAPAIGVNVGGGAVVGTPEQFTLLDQRENTRIPQTSQHIGGNGLGDGVAGTSPDGSVRSGAPSLNGDGVIQAPRDNVALESLAVGWIAPPTP